MAVNIIAWNMQGFKNTGYSDAYPLIFSKILPKLFDEYPADYWLIYLCEAGNPWPIDASKIVPGATLIYFNSDPEGKQDNIAWTIPKNFAVNGVYSPWQQPDKQGNLRCSVMIMEVTKYGCDGFPRHPRFQFSFDFLKAGSEYDNIRPIVYAIKKAGSNRDYSIAGVHNVASQGAAIGPTNTLAKSFSGGTRGACIVGDMNIRAPIALDDPWPPKIDFGTYHPVLSRQPTQLSLNQLDWALQNMGKADCATATVVRNLSKIPKFESGQFSGLISSDHEVLFYQIAI